MIPCASQNRRPPRIAPALIANDDHLTLGKALKHHETRPRGTQAARAGARTDNRRHMNPLLSRLQPYPFERLRQLFATVTPSPDYPAISLGRRFWLAHGIIGHVRLPSLQPYFF